MVSSSPFPRIVELATKKDPIGCVFFCRGWFQAGFLLVSLQTYGTSWTHTHTHTHTRSSSREVRIRGPFVLQSIVVGEPSPQQRVKGHYVLGDLGPSTSNSPTVRPGRLASALRICSRRLSQSTPPRSSSLICWHDLCPAGWPSPSFLGFWGWQGGEGRQKNKGKVSITKNGPA